MPTYFTIRDDLVNNPINDVSFLAQLACFKLKNVSWLVMGHVFKHLPKNFGV
ncbi:hypothetical protein [Spirosoma flavus]